jgi:hypothetical protein
VTDSQAEKERPYFLKKRSKKIMLSLSAPKKKSRCDRRGTSQTKVFWFFFQKRTFLLFVWLPQQPAPVQETA